jgi:hypothetical protein
VSSDEDVLLWNNPGVMVGIVFVNVIMEIMCRCANVQMCRGAEVMMGIM